MSADKKHRSTPSGRPLPPPAGFASWVAFAVSTMDTRRLQGDHEAGEQAHWPPGVTREQMAAAARAELDQIEGGWGDVEKASSGKIETTVQLLDWAENEIAKRESKEATANPAAMRAIDEQAHVTWRGRDLSCPGAIMRYAGRLHIDGIRGAVSLPDLAGGPCLDEVLWADDYDVEIRVVKRLSNQR